MPADIVDFHEAAQALEMYHGLKVKRAISDSEYKDLKDLMFSVLRASSSHKNKDKEIE